MSIIFKIARAELRNLFYSPVAWFVLIAFYVFGGVMFAIPSQRLAMVQELLLNSQPGWPGFEDGVGGLIVSGISELVLQNIYLFLPLLTMAVISREVNTGTIKLLYSSPIRTSDIVVGKYLGLVIFNLVLVLCIAFLLVTAYFTINNAEYKWYGSLLLGIFLLMNTYAAIGLFISSTTNYPIVAAAITFTVFFALSVVSGLGQQYDLIRDITFFLSIAGKAELMINGLITSRDVLYFILVTCLFLGFTIIKINSTQESKSWTIVFSRYLVLMAVFLCFGYFSSRSGHVAYLDLTDRQLNTIRPSTQDALKELDGSPLTVTLFTNLLGKAAASGLPQTRNVYIWNVWEPFRRFYPNIEFRYEYYYDVPDGDSTYYKSYPGKTLSEIADITAEVLGIRRSIFKNPDEMRSIIDLSDEEFNLIMQVEYKGKKAFLRTYRDSEVWPNEEHFSGTIKRLARVGETKVAFTTGHFERSPYANAQRDYAYWLNMKSSRAALINKGMDVDTISLIDQNIPSDVEVLVVADPRAPLDEVESAKIIKYLNGGGNALFLAEPGKQFILQPVMTELGLKLDNGTIVSPNDHEMPHIFTNKLTAEGNWLAKEPVMEWFQKYKAGGAQVQNEGALNISKETKADFEIKPVIIQPGNKNTWIENGVLVVDSAAPAFSLAEGDIKKNEYAIAVQLTRQINNKEQRIIVVGDADIMAHKRTTGNSLGLALFSWALNNKYPVYANIPAAPDKFLSISHKTASFFPYIFVYGIPGILLVLSTLLLIRRKRK